MNQNERIQQLENTLREILRYFPSRKTIEVLKADAGLGYRPAPCGKGNGLGSTPCDSDVIRWLDVLENKGI